MKGVCMALYKEAKFFKENKGLIFDQKFKPGIEAPHPGIYRCAGCGDEIAIAGGHRLPPQNHHQHTLLSGDIEWQLIVCATSVR
jgi:hypothetical protein